MPLSWDVPNLSHEKCAGAWISVSSRFSVNSSDNSGRSRRRSFEFLNPLRDSDQFPGASSSLRSDAGLDDVLVNVLDESCDGDVEDELVHAGTTIGTKFSALPKIVFSCLVNRGCLPLTHS